jgi:hypothetical protein
VRLKVAILLFLATLAAFGAAQDKVFVRFPDKDEREVWVATGLPSTPPSDSLKVGDTQVEIDVKGKDDADAIFIWDKRNGNLASKTVGDVRREGTWMFKDSFLDVAMVVVNVESGGKPVSAANVKLKDARREQTQLLDPSAGGKATFFAVKPGNLRVTVEYRANGASAKPITQLLQAPLKRDEAVPTLTIALPSGVATGGEAEAKPSEETTAKPEGGEDETASKGGEAESSPAEGATASPAAKDVPGTQPANPLGSFVVVLLGAAIVAGLVFAALRLAKNNPQGVTEHLEKLGVQIPKPGDEPLANAGTVPAAPAPPKPAPPQKIILDDAAPTPLTSAPPAPVPSAATGIPRLIGDGGDVLDLPEGETVVGREVGLGLSLVGESTVSRRHAALIRTGSTVVVRDLGSTNGTLVNNAPLTGDSTLRPGDSVQFGAVRFRYEA